jgi:hypothetical protein
MSSATNVFGPSLGDWVPNRMKGYFSTSQHFTQLGGPQAPFMFNGDAVAVYGTVSPFHAKYSVTLDGVKHDFLGGSNGLASYQHNNTLLYFSNNLASQSHNLTLTDPGQRNTGKFMDLDRIVVFASNGTNSTLSNYITSQPDPVRKAQVPEGNTTNIAVHHPNVSHPSKRLSPVVIKILVAGISIFILLLVVLAVFLIRRRRANRTHLRMPSTPHLPLQTPPGISPSESKPQNFFYNHNDPENGVEPPLSAVRPAPRDNPLADDVMRDSRDDRAGELINEGGVVSRSH